MKLTIKETQALTKLAEPLLFKHTKASGKEPQPYDSTQWEFKQDLVAAVWDCWYKGLFIGSVAHYELAAKTFTQKKIPDSFWNEASSWAESYAVKKEAASKVTNIRQLYELSPAKTVPHPALSSAGAPPKTMPEGYQSYYWKGKAIAPSSWGSAKFENNSLSQAQYEALTTATKIEKFKEAAKAELTTEAAMKEIAAVKAQYDMVEAKLKAAQAGAYDDLKQQIGEMGNPFLGGELSKLLK